MSGSEVVEKCRQQVDILDAVEALPALEEIDPAIANQYHVDKLAHYCKLVCSMWGLCLLSIANMTKALLNPDVPIEHRNCTHIELLFHVAQVEYAKTCGVMIK